MLPSELMKIKSRLYSVNPKKATISELSATSNRADLPKPFKAFHKNPELTVIKLKFYTTHAALCILEKVSTK
jgi:hypothetical protein